MKNSQNDPSVQVETVADLAEATSRGKNQDRNEQPGALDDDEEEGSSRG